MVSPFDSEKGAIFGTFDKNSCDAFFVVDLFAREISISAFIFEG